MNVNGLARAIIARDLHPDFPMIVSGNNEETFEVIAYFIDAEKIVICVDTTKEKSPRRPHSLK